MGLNWTFLLFHFKSIEESIFVYCLFLGFCTKGCKNPFHGKNCSEVCPSECKDGTCNLETGDCLSCGPGKRGVKCDESKLWVAWD